MSSCTSANPSVNIEKPSKTIIMKLMTATGGDDHKAVVPHSEQEASKVAVEQGNNGAVKAILYVRPIPIQRMLAHMQSPFQKESLIMHSLHQKTTI